MSHYQSHHHHHPSSLSQIEKEQRVALPSRVAQWYYKHGLFISSYPTCATSLAIFFVLFCCYPLLNIPLPGTIPTKIVLPYAIMPSGGGVTIAAASKASQASETAYDNDASQSVNAATAASSTQSPDGNVYDLFNMNNLTFEQPFPWASDDPFIYIQQIVLRTSVVPWKKDLLLTDAYRAPLHEVFKLLEIVRNHEDEASKTSLSNLCLHIENVKMHTKDAIFPEYNCLILSPANFWQQNPQNFKKDTNLLSTIFHYHNLQKSKVSTSEMLFGMQLRDSGIKRYPIRIRPRIIQYAITLVLEKNDAAYLGSLRDKLVRAYPLHQNGQQTNGGTARHSSITYIYYPSEFNPFEFVPMCLAFVILFVYVYFSVRKMDAFKSRLVLATCAVMTVLSSLLMTLGLCFFFGLTSSMQSRGVLPYLIILFGLENVLVITKSVVSTDEKFDVKIRIAHGLNKEGWSISKTLLTEITILTIGLITFVPVIQEFCIFAIVGLISDFFMQMLLFSTILAMNIRRVDYSSIKQSTSGGGSGSTSDLTRRIPYRFGGAAAAVTVAATSANASSTTISRSRSHPKFSTAMDGGVLQPTDVVASGGKPIGDTNKIPKRVKIVNFWARTRFFQRAFMLWMIVWIFSIIYNSGIFEHFLVMDNGNGTLGASGGEAATDDALTSTENHVDEMAMRAAMMGSGMLFGSNANENGHNGNGNSNNNNHNDNNNTNNNHNNREAESAGTQHKAQYVEEENYNLTEQLNKLRHPDLDTSMHLSNFHWSSILRQYNISSSGKYVTVLPSIRLSHAVDADEAAALRNADEKPTMHFQWKALAIALDPIDFADMEEKENTIGLHMSGGNGHAATVPLYPKTPMEILLATILCAISIFVLSYMMIVFYRCICSRNYAEWRSSWNERDDGAAIASDDADRPLKMQRIFEGAPMQIKGHRHRLECMATDGRIVATSCLDGKIATWDSTNGEKLTAIDRSSYFKMNRRLSGSYMRPLNNLVGTMVTTRATGTTMTLPAHLNENSNERNAISPIWCLDYMDNLIVIGCADGKLEFWDTTTTALRCIYEGEDRRKNGVTHLHLTGDRVVAARLNGRIDFLRLETYNQGRQIDWGFMSAYRRTHVRTGSTGSLSNSFPKSSNALAAATAAPGSQEELRCFLEQQHQGHQQPINCMEVVGTTVLTGSQDHTLKVYKLDVASLVFTLHGHYGPITSVFIDHFQCGTGGSGSQDGLLCVWDLITGACMYSIQAHDGAILSLVCASSYVISLGADERIYIWERFQGNLLNTINVPYIYTSLLMLTPSLLVTAKPGSLLVLDVRTGEQTREIKLDSSRLHLCPKQLLLACGSVICDYGNELRIVRFPLVNDKCE